jgi:hypothetical protein
VSGSFTAQRYARHRPLTCGGPAVTTTRRGGSVTRVVCPVSEAVASASS